VNVDRLGLGKMLTGAGIERQIRGKNRLRAIRWILMGKGSGENTDNFSTVARDDGKREGASPRRLKKPGGTKRDGTRRINFEKVKAVLFMKTGKDSS